MHLAVTVLLIASLLAGCNGQTPEPNRVNVNEYGIYSIEETFLTENTIRSDLSKLRIRLDADWSAGVIFAVVEPSFETVFESAPIGSAGQITLDMQTGETTRVDFSGEALVYPKPHSRIVSDPFARGHHDNLAGDGIVTVGPQLHILSGFSRLETTEFLIEGEAKGKSWTFSGESKCQTACIHSVRSISGEGRVGRILPDSMTWRSVERQLTAHLLEGGNFGRTLELSTKPPSPREPIQLDSCSFIPCDEGVMEPWLRFSEAFEVLEREEEWIEWRGNTNPWPLMLNVGLQRTSAASEVVLFGISWSLLYERPDGATRAFHLSSPQTPAYPFVVQPRLDFVLDGAAVPPHGELRGVALQKVVQEGKNLMQGNISSILLSNSFSNGTVLTTAFLHACPGETLWDMAALDFHTGDPWYARVTLPGTDQTLPCPEQLLIANR